MNIFSEEKNSDSEKSLRHEPNWKERMFFLFSGMAMSIPFTLFFSSIADQFLQRSLPGFLTVPLLAILAAPLLEEFAKAFPLFYRHRESQKSIVTLGFLTGLGFGIIEFFLYVLAFGAPILVRLPAMFFHATNTAIVGYGISIKRALPFYALAVFLHAAINFGATLAMSPILVPLAAVLISYIVAFVIMRLSSRRIVAY